MEEVESIVAELSGLPDEERPYALACILSQIEEQTERLNDLCAAMQKRLAAEAYAAHNRFKLHPGGMPQSWAQWCGYCGSLVELWGRLLWLLKRCARADLPPYDYDTATQNYEERR